MTPRLLAAAALALTVGACASSGLYGPPPPPPPTSTGNPPPRFNPEDFAWSTKVGPAALRGSIGYRGPNAPYVCRQAAVALTPDTPYSRRRIMRLYGSVDRAAVPISVVRSRQANAPSDEFRRFVRTTRCNMDEQFSFDGLPAGGWFVIVTVTPASAQGEKIVLLRRVQTGRSQQPQRVVMG